MVSSNQQQFNKLILAYCNGQLLQNSSVIETKPKVRAVKGGAKPDAVEPTGEHFGAITVPIEAATNGVWAGVLNIPPKHTSEPHHHGDQAVIVYIISGGFNLIGSLLRFKMK